MRLMKATLNSVGTGAGSAFAEGVTGVGEAAGTGVRDVGGASPPHAEPAANATASTAANNATMKNGDWIDRRVVMLLHWSIQATTETSSDWQRAQRAPNGGRGRKRADANIPPELPGERGVSAEY